ncbi:MAG: tetratricopeptide repeat protein [Spirochaetia bacterium]|nr:tetratricopeptide repeat protein [Spirochaetia bacterium]
MNFNILSGGTAKRKSHMLRNSLILLCCVLFISAATFFIHRFIETRVYQGNSLTHLAEEWKKFDYRSVYDISAAILKDTAFNNRALTYHGYSAFYLAIASVEPSETQALLDEAIINLRLALQNAKPSLVPQLEYMLGKAYFYKNSASNYHYYADLAVLYLNRALKDGYEADDIPEYLGLSYASLGMTMESISAFTKALLTRESDLLLLSIAEQYYNAGQFAAAEQYLFRISKECRDEKITVKSHLILGKIYTEQKKFSEAEKEFEAILEKNENSADALYGLGVIYENLGELIKARSYWRKALKVQVNHPESLKKLSEGKL